ncbi:MAG: 3-isopropylmalate dehydratase large subunit [Steroidobacteraceae bacterium]
MTPKTLFEKIWQQHVVRQLDGDAFLLAIDRVFLHERTGSVALNELERAGRRVLDPKRVFCTMDHIVDTLPGRSDHTLVPGGDVFIRSTRAAARAAGIRLFDVNDSDQGIVHVISPELGVVLPGLTLVCPDSHTCTQGALGAFAWGIGSTEAEHALATGTLRVSKPRTMRVWVTGQLRAGVNAKDLSLLLLSRHGAAGGQGYVVEYAGSAITGMNMESRLTLCNMATEFAAVSGIIAPDDTTYEYLAGRRYAPRDAQFAQAVAAWHKLPGDDAAGFDKELTVDASDLAPMVTWGTSPQHAVPIGAAVPDLAHSRATPESFRRALEYMGVAPGTAMSELTVNAAFIGSCTNSRLPDLRAAARLLAGRKVAKGVKAICVPGSSHVKRAAEAEGLHRVFQEAGFEWRESGCSMCFFAGGESFGPKARVISTTNRNFESRQGPGTRTHIASPETVAASAVTGHITDPTTFAVEN